MLTPHSSGLGVGSSAFRYLLVLVGFPVQRALCFGQAWLSSIYKILLNYHTFPIDAISIRFPLDLIEEKKAPFLFYLNSEFYILLDAIKLVIETIQKFLSYGQITNLSNCKSTWARLVISPRRGVQ